MNVLWPSKVNAFTRHFEFTKNQLVWEM